MAAAQPTPEQRADGSIQAELCDLVLALAHTIVEREDLASAQEQLECFFGAVLAIGMRSTQVVDAMPVEDPVIGNVLMARVQPLIHQRMAALWDATKPLDLDQAVDWVGGAAQALLLLVQFGSAMTRVIAESGVARSGRDFSFAGNSDFIPINEVIQLLGGGKHRGVLNLSSEERELDIYFENSLITFISPHQMQRLILPERSGVPFKEVPRTVATLADRQFGIEGKPIAQTLCDEQVIRQEDVKRVAAFLGTDALFDLMRSGQALQYRYYRLGDLPEFALDLGMFMPCTPVLLEINKMLDDWQSMHKVFPDPDQVLEPCEDLFALIGSMDLGVVDLQLLSRFQERPSPRQLGESIGMPLHETYGYLLRFARDGLLKPPCEPSVFAEYLLTIEEDQDADGAKQPAAVPEHQDLGSALDSILGGEGSGLAPSDSLKLT